MELTFTFRGPSPSSMRWNWDVAAMMLIAVALIMLLPRPAEAFRKAPAGLEAAALAAASHAPLPVRGDARATRDLLLAIAEHESAFRFPIIRCKVTGDNGRAFGAYQLHREAMGDHTPEEVCASDTLQAKLALGALHRHLAVFPDLGIRGAVRGYASGFPTKDTKASREILMMWRARRAK